jgi:hypothetical protein
MASNVKEFREEESTLNQVVFVSKILDHLGTSVGAGVAAGAHAPSTMLRSSTKAARVYDLRFIKYSSLRELTS